MQYGLPPAPSPILGQQRPVVLEGISESIQSFTNGNRVPERERDLPEVTELGPVARSSPLQCALCHPGQLEQMPEPMGPGTHGNQVQSQHVFIEHSYLSHKQARLVMVRVFPELTFGDKGDHLPFYI